MNAEELAHRLSGDPIRPVNGTWMVLCPAHADKNPSLAIRDGAKGAIMHCHAGCTTDAILAVTGLTWTDLYDEEQEPRRDLETVYYYADEQGHTLFEVVRSPGKRFHQRHADPAARGGYAWDLRGVRRVLYRLPDVQVALREGREVWVCEGEKDADMLSRHVTATTSPMGAGKWRDEYAEALTGANVTVWADADEPGREHARAVRDSLLAHDCQVRIVEAAVGKDAWDHLTSGRGLGDVIVTVPFNPPSKADVVMRIDDFLNQPIEQHSWAMLDLLRKQDVLMITGFEGHGKSTLLKQIAMCAAVGYDPFRLTRWGRPVRVLYLDFENSVEDCIADFGRLHHAVRTEVDIPADNLNLYVACRDGLNLAAPADLAWLIERVQAVEPDLLVMGPLYNMVSADMAKEETAQTIKRAVNLIRHEYDCAVVMEHHPPHRYAGEARDVRPLGSSLLMRWVGFGFGLNPTGKTPTDPYDFAPWRASRRRGRRWPDRLVAVSNSVGWYWMEAPPE